MLRKAHSLSPPRLSPPRLSPPRLSQEGQEFMTTCLVDEEEMKKLLRERGHMLENHVERLWAYLTIQELLAKRYQPIGCLGEWGHNPPRVPPQPLGL